MPNDPYEWTQTDAIALRNYIGQNPKFIHRLRKTAPKVKGSTMEERAMTGSELKGRTDTIEEIDKMQKDPLPDTQDAGFIPDEQQ